MFDFKLWKPNSKIYQGLNLAKFSSLKIDIIKWGYTGFPGTLPNNRPFKSLIVHACMIPQALCTGVTISQTPRKVVSKAPGGKYFSAAEWGKGTALTWNNPASTRGWALCPPCSFHPSPKVSSFLAGEEKWQPNSCSEMAAEGCGEPPWLWAAFPVPVLRAALAPLHLARWGMLLLPPSGKPAEVNYWTTPNIQASLEQGKQAFSTNNTTTEIYVFFALWSLFSKSENAEELNSRLFPGFTAERLSSLLPYSSTPMETDLHQRLCQPKSIIFIRALGDIPTVLLMDTKSGSIPTPPKQLRR